MKFITNIFFTFLVLQAIALQAHSQALTSKKLKEIYLPDFMVERSESLSKEKSQQSPFSRAFYDESIQSVQAVYYVSSATTKGQSKIRFRVIVYNYRDSIASKKKMAQIQGFDDASLESSLQKDWDFVFLNKEQIIRIDAICLMPEKKWHNMKGKLQKQLPNSIKGIECFCGKGCIIH